MTKDVLFTVGMIAFYIFIAVVGMTVLRDCVSTYDVWQHKQLG